MCEDRLSEDITVARTSDGLRPKRCLKARANDTAAWDDLEAVWKLARSLDRQPQMMEQTAAFSMMRMINAVAWKLPLPAPGWFAELQSYEPLPRLVEAFQYQVASYWQSGVRFFPTKWLADSAEHDRLIAEELMTGTSCDVTSGESAIDRMPS